MKKIKNNKGITLVALIITIIVLLILAVVAISAVNGDGIIAHAKNARDSYQTAQSEENTILSNYLTTLKNINGTNNSRGNLYSGEFDEDLCIFSNDINYFGDIVINLNNTTSYKINTYVANVVEDGENYKIEITSETKEMDLFDIYNICKINDKNIILEDEVFLKEVHGNVTQLDNLKLNATKCFINTGVVLPSDWGHNIHRTYKEIILENGILSLPDWCFSDSGVEKITIPSSVTSISSSAFSGCSELTNIIVGSEDVKTLVQNTGYTGNIILDTSIN